MDLLLAIVAILTLSGLSLAVLLAPHFDPPPGAHSGANGNHRSAG